MAIKRNMTNRITNHSVDLSLDSSTGISSMLMQPLSELSATATSGGFWT